MKNCNMKYHDFSHTWPLESHVYPLWSQGAYGAVRWRVSGFNPGVPELSPDIQVSVLIPYIYHCKKVAEVSAC